MPFGSLPCPSLHFDQCGQPAVSSKAPAEHWCSGYVRNVEADGSSPFTSTNRDGARTASSCWWPPPTGTRNTGWMACRLSTRIS